MEVLWCVYISSVYITYLSVQEAVKDCDHKALKGKKNTDKKAGAEDVMVKFLLCSSRLINYLLFLQFFSVSEASFLRS